MEDFIYNTVNDLRAAVAYERLKMLYERYSLLRKYKISLVDFCTVVNRLVWSGRLNMVFKSFLFGLKEKYVWNR